jgi:hypothetical protein
MTLTRIEASSSTISIRSPHANWWPKMLTGNIDGRVLENEGLDLYSTPAPFAFWIAIDRKSGQ